MKIAIDGMHCQACVRRVKAAIDKTVGDADASKVDIGSAEVSAPDESSAAVLAAIEKAGYPARLAA